MKVRLKKLADQIIVLTGATSGIGLATARAAARRGARLVLVARNEEALREVCEELRQQGAQAVYAVADVGNEEQVRQAAQLAIERFGGFDTWINNAGLTVFGSNEQVSTEDKRKLFETNFWGVVYGSMAAVEHLKSRGGALINVGSQASDHAVPWQSMYSASKHAVKGFTDSLRVELEQQGAPVSVTLVKPSPIDTMFVKHAKNYMDVEPRLPAPVYAPEIVADAILYVAEHPKRDIFVGSASKLSSMGAYYAPDAMDRGMKRFLFGMLRTDRPAGSGEGSLYRHGQDLQERGGVGRKARRTSVYTSAVTHPRASAALLLGAGVALAALWQSRRHRHSDPGPAVAGVGPREHPPLAD